MIHHGEAFQWLRSLPDASADALITDPPYSSGGLFRGDRVQPTGDKYVQRGVDFAGDNRDQRSFLAWCALWLSEAQRVLRPGAPVVLFIDWRQLPIMTDAIQAGGFTWRGIAVWDKTEATRPQMGAFRAQCEYLVWGTNGPADRSETVGVLPGLFRHPVEREREHQTQKPLALMLDVVRICEPDGLILDPFAGSGTTGAAAIRTGRRFAGCEMHPHFVKVAAERLAAELAGRNHREPTQESLWPGIAPAAPDER